jgi:hypothetical protein
MAHAGLDFVFRLVHAHEEAPHRGASWSNNGAAARYAAFAGLNASISP